MCSRWYTAEGELKLLLTLQVKFALILKLSICAIQLYQKGITILRLGIRSTSIGALNVLCLKINEVLCLNNYLKFKDEDKTK
mmetsp:Transcript_25721/g.39396  ORF Transcript_25721/g.39396 Transcript_25721/m.39396 type:complete len:82 (+) Transcript_25721:359-604(+)